MSEGFAVAGKVVAGEGGRGAPEFGTAFVGRDRELATLADALARPPAVLLVEGEAGIGKSRLVHELLTTPEGERYRCLTVSCPPFREPFTLGPVVDAVRQVIGGVAGLRLSGLAGALRPLFPEWAKDLPPTPEPLDDARVSRHRVFRALVEVLDRLNVGLVVVDDAHWADEATIEFLMFVTTQPARSMSLVITYRPEEVRADSLLPRLVTRAPAGMTFTRVSLTGLDAPRTSELVSGMLGAGAVSDAFAESLCHRTGGIPFVMEQLVRLMVDRADLIHRNGQWMRHELHTIEVPPTVRDAILERVHRLPHQVRAVLRAAAVLGDPVDEATLLTVADLADGDDAIAGALESGLLIAHGAVFAPRHALAAAAIYESIPTGRRRVLHRRAGQTLEAIPGQPVERLAHHFRAAGEMSEGYRYAERAAGQALAAGDHTSAVSLLRDLLDHTDRPDRSVLRLVNTIEASNLRPPDRYVELTDAVRSMLDRLDLTPEWEALVRFSLARLLMIGRTEEGRVEMLRAVPGLADDPVLAKRAMLSLAIPDDPRTSVAEHLRWLRRAADLPKPADPTERLAYQVNEVSALLAMGLDEGWAAAGDLPDDVPTASQRHAVATARVNMADAAMYWGWYDRAAGYLAGAEALADPGMSPGIHDMIGSTWCHVDWFIGRWDGLAERASAIDADDDALRASRLEARLVEGLVLGVTDADERAVERFQSILASQLSELGLAIEAAAHLGRCWLERDNPDRAIHVTEEPMAVLLTKRVWIWASELVPVRVSALLAVGRDAEAADLVDRFDRGVRGRDLPAPRAALAWCRALLAEHHGDLTSAARRYARVAATWRAMPRPYDALLAAERRAECLLAAGRANECLDPLVAVFGHLTELGAVVASNRVAGRLRDLGVDTRRERRGRRGYGDELSPSELDVVRLVVTGKTNREIGQALSRSPRTVSNQLYSVMRKLGVSSRTEVVVRALETGIVSGADPPEPVAGEH